MPGITAPADRLPPVSPVSPVSPEEPAFVKCPSLAELQPLRASSVKLPALAHTAPLRDRRLSLPPELASPRRDAPRSRARMTLDKAIHTAGSRTVALPKMLPPTAGSLGPQRQAVRASPYVTAADNTALDMAARFPFHQSLRPLKHRLVSVPPPEAIAEAVSKDEHRRRGLVRLAEREEYDRIFRAYCRSRSDLIPTLILRREILRQQARITAHLDSTLAKEEFEREEASQQCLEILAALRRACTRLAKGIAERDRVRGRLQAERQVAEDALLARYAKARYVAQQRYFFDVSRRLSLMEGTCRFLGPVLEEARAWQQLTTAFLSERERLRQDLRHFRREWLVTHMRALWQERVALHHTVETEELRERMAMRREAVRDHARVMHDAVIPQRARDLALLEQKLRRPREDAAMANLRWVHLQLLESMAAASRRALRLEHVCTEAPLQSLAASPTRPLPTSPVDAAATPDELTGAVVAAAAFAALADRREELVAVHSAAEEPPLSPEAHHAPDGLAAAAAALVTAHANVAHQPDDAASALAVERAAAVALELFGRMLVEERQSKARRAVTVEAADSLVTIALAAQDRARAEAEKAAIEAAKPTPEHPERGASAGGTHTCHSDSASEGSTVEGGLAAEDLATSLASTTAPLVAAYEAREQEVAAAEAELQAERDGLCRSEAGLRVILHDEEAAACSELLARAAELQEAHQLEASNRGASRGAGSAQALAVPSDDTGDAGGSSGTDEFVTVGAELTAKDDAFPAAEPEDDGESTTAGGGAEDGASSVSSEEAATAPTAEPSSTAGRPPTPGLPHLAQCIAPAPGQRPEAAALLRSAETEFPWLTSSLQRGAVWGDITHSAAAASAAAGSAAADNDEAVFAPGDFVEGGQGLSAATCTELEVSQRRALAGLENTRRAGFARSWDMTRRLLGAAGVDDAKRSRSIASLGHLLGGRPASPSELRALLHSEDDLRVAVRAATDRSAPTLSVAECEQQEVEARAAIAHIAAHDAAVLMLHAAHPPAPPDAAHDAPQVDVPGPRGAPPRTPGDSRRPLLSPVRRPTDSRQPRRDDDCPPLPRPPSRTVATPLQRHVSRPGSRLSVRGSTPPTTTVQRPMSRDDSAMFASAAEPRPSSQASSRAPGV